MSAKITDYSHTLIFSMALVKGLEIRKLELSPHGGEAAFEIAVFHLRRGYEANAVAF